LQDDPEKTSANRLIFTYLIGFCLMHMLANSLVASDRQDTKARLKYTQFEAAFTLGNLYHHSLSNYLPNEQAAIRKLLFNHSELALPLSLKHKLTLEQTLWLLAMVDNVFAKKDLTQLKFYQLAVLLDPNDAVYNWLTMRKLNTAVFMRLPEQHLLILHEYSQRIKDELAPILLDKTLGRLFDYLAAQSEKLTYESLFGICFAIAHDFKIHEVSLCQRFNQTLHHWVRLKLEPQKIQHYLSIIKALDFTPEHLAAMNYGTKLLDLLNANIEQARHLQPEQLEQLRAGTHCRKLLQEGKLNLANPLFKNIGQLKAINQIMDYELISKFIASENYSLTDLADFIKSITIENINNIYNNGDITQLLQAIENWQDNNANQAHNNEDESADAVITIKPF
jgi:hypothetical protein